VAVCWLLDTTGAHEACRGFVASSGLARDVATEVDDE